jgi:short-subunit dehydrogenase
VIDTAKYGPWALIAGGSESVGAEFALLLAEAGLNLVLVARKSEPLGKTADRCRQQGVEVRIVPADLSDPAACAQIASATSRLEVGLLILVAGANTHSHEFLDGDLAGFQRVIDLNVTTPLALVHHYGPAMRSRRRGGIVLLGSLAATWDRRGNPSTAASRRSPGSSPRVCGWSCATTTSTCWSWSSV